MKKFFGTSGMKESLGLHSTDAQAEPSAPVSLDLVKNEIKRLKNAVVIEVDRIEPDPDQPRKHFDETELQQLADSLSNPKIGQLQPISVWLDRSSEERKYVIIAGERRWRASKLAGLTEINAIVEKRRLTPEQIRIRQYAENATRSDFRPIERALFYKEMQDTTGASTRELAKQLHTSASGISRALKLLQFPSDIQEQIERGVIPPTVAYQVLKFEGEEKQRKYITDFLAGETSTEEIEANTKPSSTGRPTKSSKPRTSKAKTIDGLKISLTSKERLTNSEIAERLQCYVDQLQNDGRSKKAA